MEEEKKKKIKKKRIFFFFFQPQIDLPVKFIVSVSTTTDWNYKNIFL